MIARFVEWVYHTCKTLVAVSIAVLAVLITIVVVQRYVSHQTPRWAEELPRLILVWCTFLGGVICAYDRTHLVTGILPHFVKNPSIKFWVDRVNLVLIILTLGLVGYGGWTLSMITMGQSLTAINVSAGVVYLALPVSCLLTIIVHLHQLFAHPRCSP